MSQFLAVRLGFFAVGIIIWFIGARDHNATLRWIGIGFMIMTVLLRFIRRPPAPSSGDDSQ